MRSRHTDITLSTAVIVFGWWLIDQLATVEWPATSRGIRFERRCKPRMSPNGYIVIRRLRALIFHNVRLFSPSLPDPCPLPNSLSSLMRGMYHDSISYLDPCSNPHPHSRGPRSLSRLRSLLSTQDPAPLTSHLLPPFLQAHATQSQSSRHETPRMDHRW